MASCGVHVWIAKEEFVKGETLIMSRFLIHCLVLMTEDNAHTHLLVQWR